MIDALIGGKVFGQTAQRTSKSGNGFVTCKVRVATGEGQSLLVSVIAFDPQPCRALLELGDGEGVALSGALTPKVWTDKQGQAHPAIDMVAHQVLTAYHVTHKRKAMDGHHPAPSYQNH